MTTNQSIQFKDTGESVAFLKAALDVEQKKYAQTPVLPDWVPGYMEARAWGYIVVGYSLIEEGLKVIAYLRGKTVPTKHSLTMLFGLLEPDDQDVLREFYSDYRATIGDHRANYRFTTLDEFLKNLDGDPNKGGTDYVGSFDWRYFLIEERKSQDMPFISIDYLHEVAFGCIDIARSLHYSYLCDGDPRRQTHSWRLHQQRKRKYSAWRDEWMNTTGKDAPSDRLEIISGPDYRGRYDFRVFNGKESWHHFLELPENFPFPKIDRRAELEAWDWAG